MYEYQEKQISKIAKSTSEILSQYVRPEEAPETDATKIETCMIDAIDKTAELTEMCFENRHPTAGEKTEAIRRFLSIVLDISHVWPCGYYAHEAELIEIVLDELAERRRDAIRDHAEQEEYNRLYSEPTPDQIAGEIQDDIISMYRRER